MDDLDSPLLDDLISQFPLDNLFDESPGGAADASVGSGDVASLTDSSISSWIDELESFLMEDDGGDAEACSNSEFSDCFLAGLLAESPGDASGEVINGLRDGDSVVSSDGGDQLEKEKVESEAVAEEDPDDDPASKKRRRYL